MEREIKRRLEFGLKAAKAAEAVIMPFYQDSRLKVEFKADRTVVTEADRGSESKIRELIEADFPRDAIIGEEFGVKQGATGFTWILDPVDGTKSFVHGVPLFGTLIGVTYEDEPVVGIANFPALKEVYYAAKGQGAFWRPSGLNNSLRARVSDVSSLSDALLCTTSVAGFERAERMDLVERLRGRAGSSRGRGDCYGHMLVATGRAEVMIDPLMHVWDSAALFPIIIEAGGRFFDLSGHSCIDGGSAVSTNQALYEAVKGLLLS